MTLDTFLTMDLDNDEGRKAEQWAADFYFDMADVDKDGHIDPQEYGLIMMFWGSISKEDNDYAFKVGLLFYQVL